MTGSKRRKTGDKGYKSKLGEKKKKREKKERRAKKKKEKERKGKRREANEGKPCTIDSWLVKKFKKPIKNPFIICSH